MRPEHWLYTIPLRLRSLFRRAQVDQELDDELRDHLEQKNHEYVAKGMALEEARRRARLDLGGIEQTKEKCRDARRVNWIQDFAQDLHFSLRMLRKSPAFTGVAVLTLALGIGANTAIFSIVNAVLLRPFSFPQPDRIVIVSEDAAGTVVSYPNFADWKDDRNVFASTSAVRSDESYNFTGGGEPERLQGRLVSAGFLSTLKVSPALGHDFTSDDDRPGAEPKVLLSHVFWNRRFNADPEIVGRPIMLNDQSYTVAGVLPRDFEFGPEADVTIPIGLSADRFKARGSDPGILVVARLLPNATVQQAQVALNVVYARLEHEYPTSNTGRRAYVTPMHEHFVGSVRRPLLILLGSVGLVLLIACANVANLLLVRGSTRKREISVRIALGANRWRIVRELLTESVLLALIGAALGVLLAHWGTAFIALQLPGSIPRLAEANVDLRVLLFTLAASVFTGLLFGLAPALRASRLSLTAALKDGDRGTVGSRQHLRSAFVVCEVALTLALLVGAGLLIQSFRRVMQVDPGFKSDNLLTMQVSVNNPDGNQIDSFFKQLQENVRRLPGVKSVAISNGLPLAGVNHPTYFIEGKPLPKNGTAPVANRYTVSPGYFQAMGIELVKGRVFTLLDTPRTPLVAVIDEALAKRTFPNEDPIGKRLSQSRSFSPVYEIVGIVRHVEQYNLDNPTVRPPQFYLSINQISPDRLPGSTQRINLLLRTDLEPTSLTSAVRAQIAALNKDQAVFNIRTMDDIVSRSVAPRRFTMMLLTVFAVAALLLASIGIYGTMSYAVAQRTREIGLRITLGAQRRNVLKMVIGEGMKLALIGVALGLIASFALTRTMRNLLFGVSATDPMTFLGIILLLAAVALFACWIPARRATKVAPLVALRYE